MGPLFVFALFLSALSFCTLASQQTGVYEQGEEVVIWVNTVGPYANRQETYEFFRLPYCLGTHNIVHHEETLGEALHGMQLSDFGLDVKFKVNVQNGTICSRHELNEEKIDLFQYSVDHNYWFSMYVDNLPVGGYVGDIDRVSGSPFLYTQFQFDIGYNGNRIIEVNLTMGRPVKLIETGPKISVDFGYSVNWIETDKLFEDRFEKYLDSEFFEHKVHWFSLFNSFMLVLFLTGFVGLILVRTLRHDLARYGTGRGKDLEATTTATNVDYSGHHQSAADYERELGDDYGWKLVHGDVFRQPYNLALLAAMIGSGVQLAVLSLLTIMITIMLDLYEERSSILTSAIFLYALTAIVSGYVSGAFYAQYGGKRWIRTMFLTAGLWPGFVVGCALLINFISIYYSTTKAIPFGTMIAMLSIWMFLIVPLTFLGTLTGRALSSQGNFPTRVNPIPRPIPEKVWYTEPLTIMLIGGLLPFGSIFIEMYFVFTSFWAYKIYYVYGFMLLVLIILCVVTACVAIVGAYFLLNSEDHRWHWTCFLAGGSISVYVYLYAIYYYFNRTKMYGLFQTVYYFGYTAIVCSGLMLMCGAVGYVSVNLFIRRIYSTVKID